MENIISARELIRQSWDLYKNNFSLYGKILSILLLPVILLIILASPFQMPAMNTFTFYLSRLTAATLTVLGIWANIIFIKLTHSLLQKETPDIKKFSREAWPLFWSYALIGLLAGIMVLLGIIFFIIPGIVFGIWFAFSYIVLVLEEKRGREALKSSKALVTGRFFQVFWRLFAPGIFFGFFFLLIIFTTYLLLGSIENSWMNAFMVKNVLFDGIQNLISLLFAPLFSIVGVILYKNLKQHETPIVNS